MSGPVEIVSYAVMMKKLYDHGWFPQRGYLSSVNDPFKIFIWTRDDQQLCFVVERDSSFHAFVLVGTFMGGRTEAMREQLGEFVMKHVERPKRPAPRGRR